MDSSHVSVVGNLTLDSAQHETAATTDSQAESDLTPVVWIVAWAILSVLFVFVPICYSRQRRTKCFQLIGVLPWSDTVDAVENNAGGNTTTSAVSADSRAAASLW